VRDDVVGREVGQTNEAHLELRFHILEGPTAHGAQRVAQGRQRLADAREGVVGVHRSFARSASRCAVLLSFGFTT